MNILDNLTKEINEIEREINDIYNKENIRYIVNNITHDKSVLKSTKQIGIHKWQQGTGATMGKSGDYYDKR